MVAVGGVASTSHVQVAGLASTFPAGSVARTSKACVPSASAASVSGLAHACQPPPSSRHSNVEPVSFELKERSGEPTFDGSPGVPSSVVSGGVRSTVTVTTSLALWPVRSTATASSARLPSAGSGQSTVNGAAEAVASGFQVPVEQPALASLQTKKSTWSTPLPASAAVAVTGRGSGAAAFTYEPAAGEVIATVGGWLSTRMPETTAEVVAFPARSVAVARRS